jgi:glycine hydroxymethyltransferase
MSELQKRDPKIYNLIQEEKNRQITSLELIASENFTSKSVMECLGSVLTNKYSEGLPGARYYGGNEYVDQIENLCIERALETYRLSPEEWGVNVQPYSGSVANMAAYLGVLTPHDRIMGLDLPSGGHLTHGYYTAKKKISATSIVFESFGYRVNSEGYIDYEELESIAERFKPKMIICGASAYPREIDYKRFREIADKCGSLLLCDMAHISGLVATQEADNPFEYCDLVTTTTHKTLRGPRSGMIFFKREFQQQINFSVFPGMQGGPHEHQIAGVATQLLEAQTPEFKQYIKQVKLNAKAMAEQFIKLGYELSTGGTDNHLILVILRNKGLTGSKVEKICEAVNISLNKNAVPGDKSALQPGGIRIGTPALTSRGFSESDFITVANLVDEAVQIASNIQAKVGKKLKDFTAEMEKDEDKDVEKLKNKVGRFAQDFPFQSL